MKHRTQKVLVLTIYYSYMTHNTHMNPMQIIHSRAFPKLNLTPMTHALRSPEKLIVNEF